MPSSLPGCSLAWAPDGLSLLVTPRFHWEQACLYHTGAARGAYCNPKLVSKSECLEECMACVACVGPLLVSLAILTLLLGNAFWAGYAIASDAGST